MSVEATFTLYCGPDAYYVSHEQIGRKLIIEYKVRGDDGVRAAWRLLKSGTPAAMNWAIRSVAEDVRLRSYRMSGKMEADLKQLLEGRLTDEHPRSDAKAAEEVGTPAAEHSEP